MSSDIVRAADTDSWSVVMPDVVNLAKYVADTEFVPKGLRGKPAAAAAAILTGRELGVGPMSSLGHIHVIEGRPTLDAQLMRSLVLGAGHELRFPELSGTRVIVEGRRKGSDSWSSVTWTIDMAKAANLAGKNTWKSYPRQMLTARATAELCRLLFADVLGGMAYTPEEIADGVDDFESETSGPEPTAPAAPARRTAKRAAPAKPADGGVTRATREQAAAAPRAETPEPDLDDVADAEVVDETTGELGGGDGDAVDAEVVVEEPPAEDADDQPDPDGQPSEAQTKALFATLSDLGYRGDREQRLDLLSVLVERRIDSSSELTRRDVGALLDTFAYLAQQPDPKVGLRELYDEMKARS